jgi:hypothetical protein
VASKTDDKLVAELKALKEPLGKLEKKLPADLRANALKGVTDTFERTRNEIDRIDQQWTVAMNAKQSAAKAARELIKRVRASVKGAFGDDSDEYELVGGTRASERKRPVRKPKTSG